MNTSLKASLAVGTMVILGIAGPAAQELAPAAPPVVSPIYGQYPAAFTQPDPMDFNDHAGYVSLFDGTSLKGWDGNPKFWRVENGAIVGEGTLDNRSGTTFLVRRDVQARDLTLKFEIKTEGNGNSGVQYRSKIGLPWLAPIGPLVTANVGPVNLDWMMTGPQTDVRPSPLYMGAVYSENTKMGIVTWVGQAVEAFGTKSKKLVGALGDPRAVAAGASPKEHDWNQYTVIARGGTFIHIVNGQVMSVMVDDDPSSPNNQSGLIGIQLEQPVPNKVYVRNIWLKKLN